MTTKIMSTVATVFLAACSQMQMGSTDAKTTATGSAGGASAQNANGALEHCTDTLGTVTVQEDTTQSWYPPLQQQGLGPTKPVLQLLLQQSNCFVIVERGKALRDMALERDLAASGELRANAKMDKGQMVAADYIVSPSVTISNNNANGVGAQLGGMLGSVGAMIGGSLSSKQASTILTLVDTRSGVQLAAAEGSAKNIDFGAVSSLMGNAANLGIGAYANTSQGKVVVAAFTDSANHLIQAVKNYKAQSVKGGLGNGGNLPVN